MVVRRPGGADQSAKRVLAYRYLHEALGLIAGHAPDLADVLTRPRAGKQPFVCGQGFGDPADWCFAGVTPLRN